MYKSFFKLNREPFGICPDPRSFFPSELHNEALAGIYYGIHSHKGIMVLTGEVGTGKTLVIRCLLDLFDRKGIAYAYVYNSLLSNREFLTYVASDLGLPNPSAPKGEVLAQLNHYLIDRYRSNQKTVIIVDEAQHLGRDVLEEVRMLTNLETAQAKLVQVILAGQPELDEKLESYPLRQLKQRVALRFRLRPLTERQTAQYIERRLKLAGGNGHSIFNPMAIQRIYDRSRGIPRLINILCENALIAAYSLGQGQVTPELVEEVAADLCLAKAGAPGFRSLADDARESDDSPFAGLHAEPVRWERTK